MSGKLHYCKHNASCRGSRRLKAEEMSPTSSFCLSPEGSPAAPCYSKRYMGEPEAWACLEVKTWQKQ